MTGEFITVLLVDDQELVRSGLRKILRRRDGFIIVGERSDGEDVVDAAEELGPDVVVMDLRMKRVDGIVATRRLQELTDPPPVLALTTFDDDELLAGVLRAGAAGFILKDAPAEGLIRAVRCVAEGGEFLDPSVTARVLSVYRSAPAPRSADDAQTHLTAREFDVLTLMGRAHSNAEIGTALNISGVTVKSHIGRIFFKLNLRDRAAAIVYAFDHGIVTPGRD